MTTETIEARIYRPCGGWSIEKGEPALIWSVSLNSLNNEKAKILKCVYRNVGFKWGQIKRAGTLLKITGLYETGPRGGVWFHVKNVEVLEEAPAKLTEVDSKMMNKWKRQFSPPKSPQ